MGVLRIWWMVDQDRLCFLGLWGKAGAWPLAMGVSFLPSPGRTGRLS